ncbi:MAG: HAMP domain-containing sensor histidine kinase, partial [Myxococcota bacterium]|nr:HAMP domain-containing sensor histidine kinase [Myxococcota bacterium]
KTAEEYCSRLDQFMADLVAVCHAGSVEAALDLTPGDLKSVIEKASGMLGAVLAENEIDLEIQFPSYGGYVYFDEIRIAHVFTNLLTNAISVTDPGGLIRIECAPINSTAGAFMECRVIDQGPGVVHAEREKIFEAFERGSSSKTAEGRGLGLALCRRIVEAHGGEIWVSGAVGCGGCFGFTLPASLSVEE